MAINMIDANNFPFADVLTDIWETRLPHLLNGNMLLSQEVRKLRAEFLRLVEGGELIIHDVDYIKLY